MDENEKTPIRHTEVRLPVILPGGYETVGTALLREDETSDKIYIAVEVPKSDMAEFLKLSMVSVSISYIPGEPSA